MSKTAVRTNEATDTDATEDDIVPLGEDQHGQIHEWNREADVVRVYDGVTAEQKRTVDLTEYDGKDVNTWMAYVEKKRGWSERWYYCISQDGLFEGL